LQSASIASALTARIALRALHASMHSLSQEARHSRSMASIDMAFICRPAKHRSTHGVAFVAAVDLVPATAGAAGSVALGWHAERRSAATPAASLHDRFMSSP
jgi:hypothetical protein